MLFEILLIAVLTLLNGLLAMSELAVVSSRGSRLKTLADKKVRGAAKAIELQEEPGRFLSAVQVGITLIGILNGALSGATVGKRLAGWLVQTGVPADIASPLGIGLVVVMITYFSLIIGELVPKQIALRNPERVAAMVAGPMSVLAAVTLPVVVILDWSGHVVLALLGQAGESEEGVTEEEVRSLIAEAEMAGVIKSEERNMIAGVMRFADRSAQALMTPRREVEVVDLSHEFSEIRKQLLGTRHARLPVQDGGPDQVVGVLLVRDVLVALVNEETVDLRDFITEAPVVLDQLDALSVLRTMRSSLVHLVLIFDEYGHFEGIVTSADVLEAITGAFREEGDEEPALIERPDGSFLVEGWMPVDEFADATGISVPEHGEYETVAGLVLSRLRRLPKLGETVEIDSHTIEVIDLDNRRVDKLLVTPIPAAAEEAGEEPATTSKE